MKKFTKIVEEIENGRFYKVNAEIELIVPAENEGEAGYLSDSILSSIEHGYNYQIINIDETNEDISENMELYSGKQGPFQEDGRTPEELIEATWDAEFGGRAPTMDEKLEFYHSMRKSGIDGELVFKTLKDKFGF